MISKTGFTKFADIKRSGVARAFYSIMPLALRISKLLPN